MRRRLPRFWWPLLVVALAAACNDDKVINPPADSGAAPDVGPSSPDTGVGPSDDSGSKPETTPPPPTDGGLAPCVVESPTNLDRPPSGALPCDLLPPGFVAK